MSQCFTLRTNKSLYTKQCTKWRILPDGISLGKTVTIQYEDCNGQTIVQTLGRDDLPFEYCGQLGIYIEGFEIIFEDCGICTSPTEADYYYFDLFPNTELRETKCLEELNDVGQFQFSYVLSFDLPETNLKFLKSFFQSNVLDNTFKPVDVELIQSSSILKGSLAILKCVDGRIQTSLTVYADHWVRGVKDCKLSDLPYDEVELTCDFMRDIILNENLYDGTGIWFPLVNYGRIVTNIPRNRSEDYCIVHSFETARPIFHLTGLLEKLFCKVGYEFCSDFFYSDCGRSIASSIINSKFGLTEKEFTAEITTGQLGFAVANPNLSDFEEVITYWESEDANWNNGLFRYSGCGEIKFEIDFTTNADTALEGTTLKIKLVRFATNGTNYQVLDEIEYENIQESTEYDGELTAEWLFTQCDDIGIVLCREVNGGLINILSAKTTICINRDLPKEGDAINLADWLPDDVTGLELIKGISEALNLKWYTNPTLNKVRAELPYKSNLWGECVDGFWIETDIKFLEVKGKKVDVPKFDAPRYLKYSFKKPDDSCVDDLDLSDELYCTTIDLGENYIDNGTREISNSLFEPMAIKEFTDRRADGLMIPHINCDDICSFNDGFKIGFIYGHTVQNDINISLCNWDEPKEPFAPLWSQYVPFEISQHTIDGIKEVPLKNLIYGLNPELGELSTYTMFDIAYRRWLTYNDNISIEYLVDLKKIDFKNVSFREVWMIEHLGRIIKVIMTKIIDFNYCNSTLTPVRFRPLIEPTDCTVLEVSDCCRNTPLLLHTMNEDCCCEFSIGGQNSNITNIQYQFQRNNGTWANFNAPLCRNRTVRAIVSYEDCPDVITDEKEVIICRTDYELICKERDAQTGQGGTGNPAQVWICVEGLTCEPTILRARANNQNIQMTYNNGTLYSEFLPQEPTRFVLVFRVGSCPRTRLVKIYAPSN